MSSATTKYQDRVDAWVTACFGKSVRDDLPERGHRLLEESLELAQSIGVTREAAVALVDYVYGRPAGQPFQEVGGVVACLAATCAVLGIDLDAAAEDELLRMWRLAEQIKVKHATKPELPRNTGSDDEVCRQCRQLPGPGGCDRYCDCSD